MIPDGIIARLEMALKQAQQSKANVIRVQRWAQIHAHGELERGLQEELGAFAALTTSLSTLVSVLRAQQFYAETDRGKKEIA